MIFTKPPLDGLVKIKDPAHQGVLRTRKGLLHEIHTNLSAQGVDKDWVKIDIYPYEMSN